VILLSYYILLRDEFSSISPLEDYSINPSHQHYRFAKSISVGVIHSEFLNLEYPNPIILGQADIIPPHHMILEPLNVTSPKELRS